MVERRKVLSWSLPVSALPNLSMMYWKHWRNVAPVASASPGGAMRWGRQNFELKLFGCKNVPYVGQINVRWWGKIFGGTKSSRGRQKASGGAKKLQGAQEAYKKNRDSKNLVLCRGAKNFSRGAPNGKHG